MKTQKSIAELIKESETRIPADLREALKENANAKELWDTITPIARRDWVLWIITAKLANTRKRRIKVACSKLASGKKRVCCFPGKNWLLKNAKKR